ncbi:MAG: hypothetical protein WEE89_01030 [Gemmatimonadota bacterium]
MADINIERKRPSLALWIVGVVIVIAVIYLAARVLGNRDAETTVPQTQTTQ